MASTEEEPLLDFDDPGADLDFDDEDLPKPSFALLLEGPGEPWSAIAERISQLGITPVRVESVSDAEEALRNAPEPISAALVPAEFADRRLKGALSKLTAAASPDPLGFIAVGDPPDRSARKHLRAANVSLALWEPFDDETLRFQLNRALQTGQGKRGRSDARVPSRIPCKIQIGARMKSAELYNLSVGGAFVKTPRAAMNGAKVTIEMRIEGEAYSFPGEVIFANVVGNLQRPNLPLGMGVAFSEVSDEAHKALRDYVASNLSQLEV